jgi:hypothetical protein
VIPEPVTVRRELDGRQVLVGEAPEAAIFSAEFIEQLPEFVSRHNDQVAVFLTDQTLFYQVVGVQPSYLVARAPSLVAELIGIQDTRPDADDVSFEPLGSDPDDYDFGFDQPWEVDRR